MSGAAGWVAEGRFLEAIALYQEAIEVYPDCAALYRGLGAALERVGAEDEEITSYRKAIALEAEQPIWVYTTLAYLLKQRGEFAAAIQVYQQAEPLSMAEAEVGFEVGRHLAECWTALDQFAEAIQAYEQAFWFRPDQLWVQHRIGALRFKWGMQLLEAGSWCEAIEQFEQIDQVQDEQGKLIPWFGSGAERWPWVRPDWMGPDWIQQVERERLANWPRITVVTPSFNQGEFIEETILSVLHQDYPALDYVIVDGGSTDQTSVVLERYCQQLTAVIVEPDRGQADAINKGFSCTTGELLIWLNSDDMLAPGALHMAALTYLRRGCDIVAGICLVHESHQIVAIRQPRVRQSTFTVNCLADVAHRWSSGEFFFQPEVFFSRRIWQQVGGKLNESLHYALDHELWLRFAEQGARLEVIGWPMALFRRHQLQKTANSVASLKELLQVTNSYQAQRLSRERTQEIVEKTSRFLNSKQRRLLVITERFADVVGQPISIECCGRDYEFWVYDRLEQVDFVYFDAILLLVELNSKQETLKQIKSSGYSNLLIVWLWDNQIEHSFNVRFAEQVDLTIPSQGFLAEILNNCYSMVLDSLPRCSSQWSLASIEEWFEQSKGQVRSNALFGCFFDAAWAIRRNRLIEQLKSHQINGNYWLGNAKNYLKIPPDQRWNQWITYQIAIYLPTTQELSSELFDALLCGLIPIVPEDVLDLDTVIDPALQTELPVIRFSEYSAAGVAAAYREAMARFEADGWAGMQRRHQFVATRHMGLHRLEGVVERLIGFSLKASLGRTLI
ncbi:MAG: glycosyltransferase [Nodosilinea sp.]